ncbi:RNA polymerase factor sigma-54 [Aquisalimonas lutea]|uniref:RNA polymerase factor sigma-54 n=1 Tax=Aquisalimonas lutea TaxID=1327750 RepID=UPI0025B420E0|nr:RNA polymerase factor sigma-54 [Aquisalimonas lutea]MDN3517376.1 RNA polymerase factor sigma-54 [Aquisalimonas lutea]
MKQSLQLRLGQQLTMTPQLQQAIKLLQLSTLELRTEIQQALDSNFMLEPAEELDENDEAEYEGNDIDAPEPAKADTDGDDRASSGEGDSGDDAAPAGATSAAEGDGSAEAGDSGEAPQDTPRDDIPDDLPLDSDWDDIYDGSTAYSAPDPDDDQRETWENRTAESGGGLHEHLLWQARLSHFTPRDLAIAEAIIDGVRDDGYLGVSLEDICVAVDSDEAVEIDEVEAVRHLIQRFDPVGVASLDPREALLVQLEQYPADTPWLAEARLLVDRHLDLLSNRQLNQLTRKLRVSQEELGRVLDLVRTLDPRPGSQIGTPAAEYVVPDVYVRKERGAWRVELNPEAAPRIRVNSYYAGLVRRGDQSSDNTTMRQHLQEARWFIKSLKSRNETLLKVASCIVNHQQEFLEHGEEAMKPLVLREVAEEVDMHESTISRITTQKYMYTPRGTFEFKYFFSSHVHTVDGEECSATSIRARIRRLIGEEDPRKPLSDSKLAEILRDEGIDVARRTVAKYRESMSIASSNERKRIA